MNSTSIDLTSRRVSAPAPVQALPAAARALLALLPRLRHGSLELQLPDGSSAKFGRGEPSAMLRVGHWDMFARTLQSGDIGFAEAYIDGQWDSPDLTVLLALLTANRAELESAVYGQWWGLLLYRLKHAFNRNSRRGSAKNIHAHYDLGNAFYALWLDRTMNYSSAWFDNDRSRPLADAQHAKVVRALEQVVADRDALDARAPTGLQTASQRVEVAVPVLTPHGLEHLDRHDRVERPAFELGRKVAVVLQSQVAARRQPGTAQTLLGPGQLLA